MCVCIFDCAELTGNTISKNSTVTSEQGITIVSAEAANSVAGEQSSVGTLKLDSTSANEAKSITVVLIQAGAGTGDQLEFNQIIDALMDNRMLSYINIAALCLSSEQEKHEMLKPLLDGVKNFQGMYVASYVHSYKLVNIYYYY